MKCIYLKFILFHLKGILTFFFLINSNIFNLWQTFKNIYNTVFKGIYIYIYMRTGVLFPIKKYIKNIYTFHLKRILCCIKRYNGLPL